MPLVTLDPLSLAVAGIKYYCSFISAMILSDKPIQEKNEHRISVYLSDCQMLHIVKPLSQTVKIFFWLIVSSTEVVSL